MHGARLHAPRDGVFAPQPEGIDMALDRWVAIIFLAISLVYGFAAYNYPLLPFERNMSFLPNTMPMVLSVLGVIVALVILFSPRKVEEEGLGDLDLARVREFNILPTLGLVGAMVAYALLLRPIGFLAATALFIAGSSIILGERKFHLLIPIAVVTAVSIWYLVQETLGIFLRPWPGFLS
jgi:putative tricarboxylic transport membrane protein